MHIKEVLEFLNEKINTATLGLPLRDKIRFIHNSQIQDMASNANSIYLTYEGGEYDGRTFIDTYCMYLICKNQNSQKDFDLIGIDISNYSNKVVSILKDNYKRPVKGAGAIFYTGCSLDKLYDATFLILQIDFKISHC